jgi:hypothetical protein
LKPIFNIGSSDRILSEMGMIFKYPAVAGFHVLSGVYARQSIRLRARPPRR